MLDKYWLKSDQDAHKEKIKKENEEILMTSLDKYWEKKGEKKAADADNKEENKA